MNREQTLEKQKELLFPCVANYYKDPVVITKAKGVTVTDVDGVEYLDFFGGILTVSLGHCHPDVVEAISEQAKTLGHTSTLYPTQGQLVAAETLARVTPGGLKKSFFTNSGSEADETAVMLAKIHTGRQEIVALRHGYHGRTHLNTTLTAHKNYRLLPSPVPGVSHVHAPYCYRCPFDSTPETCGFKCATDIEEHIQTSTSGEIAGFIAEPILGVGGFITPPKGYFKVAVDIIKKYGGVFICDEVQTAFGRTGGKWCGIEHHEGVDPDIMTFAKGIANGMPVGATIATEEVANSWTGASISTYGGNPVSMAAMNATVEVMESEDMPARVERLGKKVKEMFESFKEQYEWVGDVRGMGLMQAMELVETKAGKVPNADKANAVMEAGKREGILLGKGGLYNNTVRIAPPMMITEVELEDAIGRFSRAMAAADTM